MIINILTRFIPNSNPNHVPYILVDVTCVEKEGELVPNVVRKSGHVVASPCESKIRTSTRLRKKNILLKNYV